MTDRSQPMNRRNLQDGNARPTALRDFTFSLFDDRYPKPFCAAIALSDEACAREHAKMHLGASPHFVSVEVDEHGITLFALGLTMTRTQALEDRASTID
jgi:hypothetical protein